jgi:hypothetical protein
VTVSPAADSGERPNAQSGAADAETRSGLRWWRKLKAPAKWVGTVISAVIISVIISLTSVAQHHFLTPVKTPLGEIPLASLLPPGQHVRRTIRVNLDNAQTPQVVVLTSSNPGSSEVPGGDLLLLAWDKFARRWFTAYDAARYRTYSLIDPGFSVSGDSITNKPAPLLKPNVGLGVLRAATIRNGHHRALVFWTETDTTSGSDLIIGILEFNGVIARVGWAMKQTADGDERVSVIGPAGHQRIEVSAWWWPPYNLCDPGCPVRAYRYVIGIDAVDARGNSIFLSSYYVVSDDRPWIGVAVTAAFNRNPRSFNYGNYTSPYVRVRDVAFRSPASNKLKIGDVITGVNGMKRPVVDELMQTRPGQLARLHILRHGKPLTVTVRIASRLRADHVFNSFDPFDLQGLKHLIYL